jgi:oligopeptide transport system ATP-binding protein
MPEDARNGSDTTATPLLQVEGLTKHFPVKGGLFRGKKPPVQAVDGVSFDVAEGETLGIVGESGSGKSTVVRLIAGLLEPTSGSVRFDGREVVGLGPADLHRFRRDVQLIFQDPFGSLNPRMTVGQLVSEPWVVHPGVVDKQHHREKAQELLDRVGLNPDSVDRYPTEFSGGQRQRVGIARALALRPRLILCDEPVSALDVSVQAQVINLLRDIQREFGVSYVFIGHDLSVVRAISDRLAVMYLGRVVELGTDDEIHEATLHPYTSALLSAVPELSGSGTQTSRIVLPGEIPSPSDPPSGCRFRTRCWKAEQLCAVEHPDLLAHRGGDHVAACHFPEPLPSEVRR